MEINKLNFEKKEIQIKETYVDETGRTRERIKKVMMPTGTIVPNDESHSASSEKTTNNPLSKPCSAFSIIFLTFALKILTNPTTLCIITIAFSTVPSIQNDFEQRCVLRYISIQKID